MPRAAPPSVVDFLEAEREFRGWTGRVRRVTGARVVTSPQFRDLLVANQVLVGATDAPVGWEEIEREAEPAFRALGVRGRRAMLFGDEVDRRLGPSLRARGFRERALRLLTYRGYASVAPRPDVPVRWVDPFLWPALFALRYRIEEEAHGPGREASERTSLYSSRADSAWRRSYAATFGPEMAGSCDVVRIGSIAQVAGVQTAPEWRGQGIATAVVSRAVEETLREPVRGIYLTTPTAALADQLYAPLGFAPAATVAIYERAATGPG